MDKYSSTMIAKIRMNKIYKKKDKKINTYQMINLFLILFSIVFYLKLKYFDYIIQY